MIQSQLVASSSGIVLLCLFEEPRELLGVEPPRLLQPLLARVASCWRGMNLKT